MPLITQKPATKGDNETFTYPKEVSPAAKGKEADEHETGQQNQQHQAGMLCV